MDTEFKQPQRQSSLGILLVFAASVFKGVRNLWFLVVYFLIKDLDPEQVLYAGIAGSLFLLLALAYSIRYYLNFRFHIDYARKEFVIQKGVFSTDVINIPFARIQQVNFRRNLLQRVIGVYNVQVDTAGSKEREVDIKALSREKAERLAEELMEISGAAREESFGGTTDGDPAEAWEGLKKSGSTTYWEGSEERARRGAGALSDEDADRDFRKNSEGAARETSEDSSDQKSEGEWTYAPGTKRLLKIGLTSNYLRGLGVLLTFYIWLQEQFRYAEEAFEEVPELFFWEMGASAVLFLLLLLVVVILTVGETFIKYYGLKLTKRTGGLQVEMGLRDNTKVSIKARRVQLLQLSTNPLQKRLDMYRMKIVLGSSENELKRSQMSIPGLPARVVERSRGYFHGEDPGQYQYFRPDIILLYQKLLLSLIPLGLGLLAWNRFGYGVSSVHLVVVILGYLSLSSLYHYFSFRRIKLAVSEKFLIKYSGLWVQKKQILELYKLQALSISEPIWYRKKKRVHLSFHSAGGDLRFSFLPKHELAGLPDYLLYKMESTDRPWM